MHQGRSGKEGFSLVEVVVASSVLVIVLSLSMAGLLQILGEFNEQMVQAELDIDVQKSMESLKYDIRLSSLDEMFFYPAGPGPYTALSMPIARDNDGDGALDVDPSTGKLIWYKQLVYHVWSGEPTQLRLTTFDPRPSLTDAQLQAQINSVVTTGTGTGTYGGASASTKVVFQNLFDWTVTPRGSRFDGFASTTGRMENVYLGSCILSNATHDVKFELIGGRTSGRKVGVDSLSFSPSGSPREGETLPIVASSGATPVARYMAGGSWGGNYHLYFPASSDGHSFTLRLDNDCWEETNFGSIGDLKDDTQLLFDETLTPSDFVISLDGQTTNWFAALQTADTNSAASSPDETKGCVIRTVLKGDEIPTGGWISSDGGSCRITLRSGANQLRVLAAYIAECASSTSNSNTMDITGTICPFRFGGSLSVTVPALTNVVSDLASFGIDRARSYAVTFLVNNATGQGHAWKWNDTAAPSNAPNSYIIPVSSTPGLADLVAPTWSTRADVISTSAVYAVEEVFVTYATNGTYTSAIFDTHTASPSYTTIDWSNSVPWGTTLTIKARSGSLPNLSDAQAWTNPAVIAMTSPGSLSIGSGQYVQFKAYLTASTGGLATPKLCDVRIRWPGPQQVVDFVGAFTTGPDYGVFEVTVDGRSLLMGLGVDLEIFETIRSMRTAKRMVSTLSSEIRPRNTGK